MLIDKNSKIQLLSTLNLHWKLNNNNVAGRDFHAISIRTKGNGIISQGEKTEQLTTGTVLFVPKGVDYHIETGEEQLFVIHFLADNMIFDHIKAFHIQNFSRLIELFSTFYVIFTSNSQGSEYKALSLFYDIMYELEKSQTTTLSPDYEKIKNALDYMHANFTDPELKISKLCKLSYFSDTYFRKLFLSLYGVTPLTYLNDLRINHSKALLNETDCSVAHVALLSGFYDEKYFCKIFKKKLGKTPTQYRNK